MRPCTLVLTVAAVVAVTISCGPAPPAGRVIVLGLDGLDPETLELIVAEGSLPSFRRMIDSGAHGTLRAEPPLLSPVLWTTIATGRLPTDHGIGHFVTADRAPVTSSMRRVPALWNLASTVGLSTATVGWWATWPPEEISGTVVSDRTCYHFLFEGGFRGVRDAGLTYPPEALERIRRLVRRPSDIGADELSRYLEVEAAELERPFSYDDEVAHMRWALASAHSYADIGLELWHKDRPDLLMVYIEATDSVSHLFGHLFRVEGLTGELAEQQRRGGRAVEEIYRFADELVGRYLDAMDDRTTLIVVSDHGFELGSLHADPSRTRDMRRVSEHSHRPEGVLLATGRGVRQTGALVRAVQLDVAPTVLALLGFEKTPEMPGRVLHEMVEMAPRLSRLPGMGARRPPPAASRASAVDPLVEERLRSLGYLSDVEPSSPMGDRTIAALHFNQGRYPEAESMFRDLLRSEPNDSGLHSSLAACLGAQGRDAEALAEIEAALSLDPVNAEAYHNRGVLAERRGDAEGAAADYRTALRYSPDYEPAQRALERLLGSGLVAPVDTQVDPTVRELLEHARERALRGDYHEAARLLDEAAERAPDAAVVHEYRANVAYLAGDVPRAIQELTAALELEPDNERIRRNLESLKR